MALQIKRLNKDEKPPEDAVMLKESAALQYQLKIVHSWEPGAFLWPIKHGMLVLGLATGLSAFYFNNYYRNRLRLLHFGKMSTYLPIVVVPSILTGFLHQEKVTNRILLKPECPVCTEVRAALWQCVFGLLYPLVLAPAGSFTIALRYNTYNIPSVIDEKMKLFNLWKRMSKPLLTPITILSIVQIVMAMGLTHFELKAFYRLQEEVNNVLKNREEL